MRFIHWILGWFEEVKSISALKLIVPTIHKLSFRVSRERVSFIRTCKLRAGTFPGSAPQGNAELHNWRDVIGGTGWLNCRISSMCMKWCRVITYKVLGLPISDLRGKKELRPHPVPRFSVPSAFTQKQLPQLHHVADRRRRPSTRNRHCLNGALIEKSQPATQG